MLLCIVRLIVGTVILSYASYTDIKTRKASNFLWVIMGVIGTVLLILHFFMVGFGDKIFYLVFIPIMIAFMYILFRLRLIFGGADAKAIMALSILVPLEPEIMGFPLWKSFMPFPWVIFSNSLLMFLIIPLGLLIFNLTKRNVEFPYCFLGYRMNVEKAKKKFVWPLEKIKNGKRRFSYIPKDFDASKDFEVQT